MSLITAVNRGTSHRNSMAGVMANAGFGILRIHKASGITIEVPQTLITNNGVVKRAVRKEFNDITRETVDSLEKRGVKLYVRGAS